MDIPKAAQAHTPEGAEAFVRFYMAQVNRAWTKPDARLLPPLGNPGCRSCAALQETAQDLADKRQRYVSDPVTVTQVAAIGGAPAGQQYVRLFFDQHKVDVVDSSGAVVLTDSPKKAVRTAGVIWEEETWRMFDIAD